MDIDVITMEAGSFLKIAGRSNWSID